MKNFREKDIKFKIKVIIATVLILFTVIFFILYRFNYGFRNWVNGIATFNSTAISSVPMLNIDQDNINRVIGYGKHFAILKQNTLTGYVENTEEFSHGVISTNPIYATEGNYLILAENGSSHVYVFEDKKLVYDKDVEGEISTLAINKNGFAAISTNKQGYRSAIDVLDQNGELVFTTFLANTYASNIRISPNNKKMAIVEIDTSGIQISSSIKFVLMDKVGEEGSVVSTEKEDGVLITDLAFTNNNTVTYLTNNMVKQVNIDGIKKDVLDITDTNITNIDISLGNYIVRAEKSKSSILDNSTDIVIVNENNAETGRYTVNGTIKQIKVQNNVICANIGQEIYFITVTGRPIKKYSADSDIKDVVMYDIAKMAALIYRNKIEIIYI